MGYKWRPSKTQKREFAEKMQNDSQFAEDYYKRQEEKKLKKQASSKFDYNNAGGYYIATKNQYDFCYNNVSLFISDEEKIAMNDVIYSYTCQEKIHHDSIHIVNEKIRNTN